MSDAINKAINTIRGNPNPPGITGVHANIKYSDPVSQEAFLRGLLGIPPTVAVIIVNPTEELQEPIDPRQQAINEKRMENLEKARLAREAKAARQQEINETRLKNLKKARRKLKRMRD